MAEKAEKITKKQWFETIIGVLETAEFDQKDEAIAFLNKQITQLDNRAEKAKERAAKTKAEGDELLASIEAVMTDQLQSVDQIYAQVEGEEITRSKIVSRLKKLIDAGKVEKLPMKNGSRKVVGYRVFN